VPVLGAVTLWKACCAFVVSNQHETTEKQGNAPISSTFSAQPDLADVDLSSGSVHQDALVLVNKPLLRILLCDLRSGKLKR